MLDELLLLSGNDIPFTEAALTIHSPSLKEIGYIGGDSFFIGCQWLTFSKEKLTAQDKNRLGNLTNFELLMSIMQDKSPVIQRNKTCMELVLLLLFPEYNVSFLPTGIGLIKDEKIVVIDKSKFDTFQEILKDMFGLRQIFGEKFQYNPGNAKAEALAKQFEKYHQKLAKLKKQGQQGQNVTILSRYISILAVGEHKDINLLLKYSVYQLLDQFQRFRLKEQSDLYIQAKMAGAKDLKEVENWMKDIHSNSQE